MGTNYIAPIWRMPKNANKDKLSNYNIEFDGSRIQMPFTELSGATNCTISFWAKIDYSANVEPKFPFHLTNGTDNPILWVFNAAGTALDVYIGNVNFRLDGSFNKDIAEWNHWVLRFDGSETSINRTRVYQNGQQLTSQSGWGTATSIPSATNLILAGRNLNATQWYYQMPGNMSQCCIFDYTLSENQINYLYNLNNPMAITGAEPVAYWPLGDNSNPNADAGYPNISVGADSVFDFIPNDYIDLGTNLQDILSSNQNTISLWFRSDTASNFDTLFSQGKDSSIGYRLFLSGGLSLNRSEQNPTNNRQTITISPAPSSQTWNHLVLVTDTSAGTKLTAYLNGSPAGVYATGTITYNNQGSVAWIGGQFGISQYWDGQISNLQIWNTNLSLSDAETLYNNGQPLMTGTQPQEANLKAWYKLNQSANWEADTTSKWQIPDAVSLYPQSFDFVPNDFIDLGKPTDYDTGDLSVAIWVNITNTGGTQYIFSNSGSPSFLGFDIKVRQSNQIGVSRSSQLKSSTSGWINVGFEYDVWQHLAFTFNYATNTIKTFLNGELKDTSIGVVESTSLASKELTIGSYRGTSSFTNGKLSNAQIWNTTLSDTQIETLYNNGVPLTTAIASDNLKAWYKLDNTELFDGTNWSIENQKYPASYESALKFPGDFVSGTGINFSPLTINATQANTYSAWVYPISHTAYWTMLMGDYSGSTSRIAPISLVNSGGSNWAIRSTQRSINTTANSVKSNNISNNELGKWNHIMVVVDNLDVSFYLNGQPHGTATFTNPWTSSTFNLFNIGNFSNWVANGYMSNIAIWDSDQSTNIANIYNNGTPQNSYTVTPIALWKLDNTTTGINDIIGGRTGTLTGDITKVNTFVSTEAGISSGMTEQNLVNNNVSVFNGESNGMTTANLVTSNISRTQPFSNYSFNFDRASNDYIVVDNSSSVFNFGTNPFSISLWFNGTTFPGAYTAVLGSHGSGSNSSFWAVYVHDSDGVVIFHGGQLIGGGGPISTNEWYHYTVTRDTSGNLITYLNGVVVNTATGKTGIFNSSSTIRIADDLHNSNPSFDGKISNVCIFDRALTEQEALKIYNNGIPQNLQATSSFSNNIIAWWPLDEHSSYYDGTDWVVRDLENGNDGDGVNTGNVDDLVGNAPGSEASGTGTNLTIADLKGNMYNSDKNAYSINMADYADGVTNPANSGRSTDTP